MDDVILANGIAKAFHVNNSRQIVRNKNGMWLTAYDRGDGRTAPSV